jgi:hypothetical protein
LHADASFGFVSEFVKNQQPEAHCDSDNSVSSSGGCLGLRSFVQTRFLAQQSNIMRTLAFGNLCLPRLLSLVGSSSLAILLSASSRTEQFKLLGVPAPTVVITNPKDGSFFAAGVTATITATASAATGRAIGKVEFFTGPIKLGETTTDPYILIIPRIPEGRYTITAKATDNQGSSTTSAPINVIVGNPEETLALFTFTDDMQWRYNRDGKNLGTAWRDVNYDDSKWPAGLQPIGANPNDNSEIIPIRTPIGPNNDAGEHITTLYFRGHFNFPLSSTAGVVLTLRNTIDDGAVFYLNGVEVSRFVIGAGAVAYGTFATGSHEASTFGGPDVISAASLVPGDNVFAVEVHQFDATSSDIVFGAELTATLPAAPPIPAPKFSAPALQGTNLVVTWTGAGTLQSANVVTGPWSDEANAKSPFAAAVASSAKFYRVKQ